MIRTRDFLLFLVTMVFLATAIGLTTSWEFFSSFSNNLLSAEDSFVTSDAADLEVTVEERRIDYDGRIAYLRQQIGLSGTDGVWEDSDLESRAEELLAREQELLAEAEARQSGGVQLCGGYRAASIYWPYSGVNTVDNGSAYVFSYTESTGTEMTLLQIPKRFSASGATNCLPYDVVGVATDGSLIRNGEYGLYSVFGPNTLVGYALDGLPIYGNSDVATDACGGTNSGSGYRYYLSGDRAGVLGCFAATPVGLY